MLNINGKTREKAPFYAEGLCFSCTRCSACCRYEAGYVFLSEKDVSLLAAALKIEKMELIGLYCRWIPSLDGKKRLSLKEKPNYDCIFWADGCSVYESRPLQCRAFPFWHSAVESRSSWETVSLDCPGIGKGILHSGDSIEKWLALQHKEPIISKGESWCVSDFGVSGDLCLRRCFLYR